MKIDISNKRIIITGGAGLIGSHISDILIEKGVGQIVVLDNFTRGNVNNLEKSMGSGKVSVVKGDILDENLLTETIKGCDYCFHMAAIRITECEKEPQKAFDCLFKGTFNVLKCCAANDVKKIVVASSASVYGMAEEFPTNEKHHPYNNKTLYGAGKMSGELMLRAFHEMFGLDYVALRFFNVYGPRMDAFGKYTEVLIRWYRMIADGQRPKIFGDGKQTMDFVFAKDVARACVLALESETCNDVFNVASGEETSLESLCTTLLKAMGKNIEPEYVPLSVDRKRVEVVRRLADTSRSSELLGFNSEVGLEDGLKQLVTWLDTLD